MGVLFRKEQGFVITKMGRLAVITFIMGLSSAFVETIWAAYMYSFINNVAIIGFISAFFTLVSFFSFFFVIPLVEKSSKSKLFLITLFLFGFSYILFALTKNFYLFLVLTTILFILFSLRMTCFGIILKDMSSERQLSRNEGLNYAFLNLAWMIGPLIAGPISEKYGFNIIFVLSAIFIFIALLIFKLSKIKDANIKKRLDKKVIKNFIDFFRNKNRVFAYVIS